MLKTATAILALLVVIGRLPIMACDFCSPLTDNTMLTELDAADIALIAELNEPTPSRPNLTAFDLMNRDRQKGRSGFVVRHVLRGEPEAGVGESMTVPLRIPDVRGTMHLITYNRSEDRWTNWRLSADGMRFVQAAARFPIVDSKRPSLRIAAHRLESCQKFFGTDDFVLRKAIFAEFAAAPYAALEQLRPGLTRDDVNHWLTKATRSAEQTRQLYLLLSLCGDASDLPGLKQEFHQCVETNWSGTLDAVILAYVAIGGTEALDDVDQTLISSTNRSVELKSASAKAMKFLIEFETNIARPRLLQSCRKLLDDPQTAGLIVQDLARWENWQWEESLREN